MKKQIALLVIAVSFTTAPLLFTTGCSVTQGRQGAGEYAKDKEIQTRIKTALYADPTVKGTQVEVNSLNGNVQLSGFVDSQAAKDRAGEIAREVPGVKQVYNNLLLPTGR